MYLCVLCISNARRRGLFCYRALQITTNTKKDKEKHRKASVSALVYMESESIHADLCAKRDFEQCMCGQWASAMLDYSLLLKNPILLGLIAEENGNVMGLYCASAMFVGSIIQRRDRVSE